MRARLRGAERCASGIDQTANAPARVAWRACANETGMQARLRPVPRGDARVTFNFIS